MKEMMNMYIYLEEIIKMDIGSHRHGRNNGDEHLHVYGFIRNDGHGHEMKINDEYEYKHKRNNECKPENDKTKSHDLFCATILNKEVW